MYRDDEAALDARIVELRKQIAESRRALAALQTRDQEHRREEEDIERRWARVTQRAEEARTAWWKRTITISSYLIPVALLLLMMGTCAR